MAVILLTDSSMGLPLSCLGIGTFGYCKAFDTAEMIAGPSLRCHMVAICNLTPALPAAAQSGNAFFIADRVVSRAGVLVDRYFRRTRSADGTTFVWMARKSRQGKGPGWSGLRFDIVRDMAQSA